jgi:hypothetical protein
LATNGQGGTRLAARLGMQTSRNTILHRIMEVPNLSLPSVVYLGVDDFSFRRGYRFGTILVNLESHRVVDLRAFPPSGNRSSMDVPAARSSGGQP